MYNKLKGGNTFIESLIGVQEEGESMRKRMGEAFVVNALFFLFRWKTLDLVEIIMGKIRSKSEAKNSRKRKIIQILYKDGRIGIQRTNGPVGF